MRDNYFPSVRFHGFNENWNKYSLGDLIEITSASRVRKDEWTKSGVRFFRSSDVIAKFKGTKNIPAFISYSLYEELSEKSGIVQTGDLLVTGGGSIGIPYLVEDERPLYFKDADLLWFKSANKVDGYFLYYYFVTSQLIRYISSITHVGTISHYTIEQSKETPIILPELIEQTKIGNLFKQLDETIALQQQELTILKQTKQGFLQKMFPEEGEAVPEVRFPGFMEKWRDIELIEYVTKGISDGDWIQKEHIHDMGDYRIIQTGNLGLGVYLDKVKNSKYLNNESFQELKANEIFPGDILISRLAEPAGRTIIIPDTTEKLVTAVDVTVIRPSDFFDSYFFMTTMNSSKLLNRVSKHVSGTSHKRISRKNLEKVSLSIPNLEEQHQIGNFFKQLDEVITLHEQELEALQQTKKAFLQKMFV